MNISTNNNNNKNSDIDMDDNKKEEEEEQDVNNNKKEKHRFDVEAIVDHKGKGSNRKYCVKWVDFPSSENTWELESNLDGCKELLDEYKNSLKVKQNKNKNKNKDKDYYTPKSDLNMSYKQACKIIYGSDYEDDSDINMDEMEHCLKLSNNDCIFQACYQKNQNNTG